MKLKCLRVLVFVIQGIFSTVLFCMQRQEVVVHSVGEQEYAVARRKVGLFKLVHDSLDAQKEKFRYLNDVAPQMAVEEVKARLLHEFIPDLVGGVSLLFYLAAYEFEYLLTIYMARRGLLIEEVRVALVQATVYAQMTRYVKPLFYLFDCGGCEVIRSAKSLGDAYMDRLIQQYHECYLIYVPGTVNCNPVNALFNALAELIGYDDERGESSDEEDTINLVDFGEEI